MASGNAHTKSVNIYDAKTRLSKLVAEVESGNEITISRNGRPVARLVPYRSSPASRTPGAWAGIVEITDDFDEFSDADAADWFDA
jgi:prevent-host-death family protein